MSFYSAMLARLGITPALPATHPEKPPAAEALADALGGLANIKQLNACMTRLRVQLLQPNKANAEQLKQLGAKAVIEQEGELHAVFGEQSEPLKLALQQRLAAAPTLTASAITASAASQPPSTTQVKVSEMAATDPLLPQTSPCWQVATQCLKVFGGIDNIESIQHCAQTRIRLSLKQAVKCEPNALPRSVIEAIMPIQETLYHLISTQHAELLSQMLQQLCQQERTEQVQKELF